MLVFFLRISRPIHLSCYWLYRVGPGPYLHDYYIPSCKSETEEKNGYVFNNLLVNVNCDVSCEIVVNADLMS